MRNCHFLGGFLYKLETILSVQLKQDIEAMAQQLQASEDELFRIDFTFVIYGNLKLPEIFFGTNRLMAIR